MNNLELSEQEIIRRQSLDELRKMGVEPYPAALYNVNACPPTLRTNSKTMTSAAPYPLQGAS